MSEIVYLNGSLIPSSEASISALDYGFLYGYGLFETMRAYGGQVFRLDNHLTRLIRSAEVLGLPIGTLNLKDAVMDPPSLLGEGKRELGLAPRKWQ